MAAALASSASHPSVAPVVKRVTAFRVGYTENLFRELCFPAREAHALAAAMLALRRGVR